MWTYIGQNNQRSVMIGYGNPPEMDNESSLARRQSTTAIGAHPIKAATPRMNFSLKTICQLFFKGDHAILYRKQLES